MRCSTRVTSEQMRAQAGPPGVAVQQLHLWRSGGLGDMIFLEPALRRLKAAMPSRELILHAPRDYTDLWKLIGFDRFEENHTGNKPQGQPGMELHWTIENHSGAYCLSRVAIWEDLLGLTIGDDPVEVDFGGERSKNRKKPLLYFSPFTSSMGLAGRSLTVDHCNLLLKTLTKKYEVLMMTAHPKLPDGLDLEGVTHHEKVPFGDYYRLVASCDFALANDSGGLYVAGAAGVPSVGIYDHVKPWLRARRFPSIYSLHLRWPECRCHQHGGCTKPAGGEAPCKAVPVEEIMRALEECQKRGGQTYAVYQGTHVAPPAVAVSTNGNGDLRRTLVSLREAFRGLSYYVGVARPETAKYKLELQAGDTVFNRDLWKTLTLLEMPDTPNQTLPLPIRRVQA